MTLREIRNNKKTNKKLVIATLQDKFPSNARLVFLGCVLLLWMLFVVSYLVKYQVYEHKAMYERAEQQQQRVIETSPRRGIITDCNGRELARSVEVQSIYVAPAQVPKHVDKVEELAKILDLPKEVVLQRMTSPKVFVNLKRKVEPAQAEAIRQLNIPGIQFITETKRYYPKSELAATVLGFVNLEEEGVAGIEKQLDKHLRGISGKFLIEADAKGQPFNHYEQSAEVGQSATLTIDERIQYKVEKILSDAVNSKASKGAMAIVMKPKTGEILAMVSVPSFNPNISVVDKDELQEKRRNRTIEDAYEPGSAFKIVTYSAALEEKLLTPSSHIDCQGGSITIAGHTVLDGGKYGALTASEAFQVSSNVAAIKTGRRLGKEKLLKYVERFGFGNSTGVGLPSESSGSIGGINRWTEMSYASLPMGYEVMVTPLQVVAAISAIANDGVWVQPHILKNVVSTTGDTLFEIHPQTRRVISTQTAQEMRQMLQGVVEKGTAKLARLSGYTAGGKTGTAKKFDHKFGKYSETKYFATFVGIAPAERPEIAVVVVMDEPPFGMHHGGQASAPVFKKIAETILPILGVSSDNRFQGSDVLLASTEIPEENDPFDVPSLMKVKPLEIKTNQKEVNVTFPDNEKVSSTETSTMIAVVNRGNQVPNLIGKGVRTATNLCAQAGLKLSFSGIGIVTDQSPSPGTPVAPGSVCYAKLSQQN